MIYCIDVDGTLCTTTTNQEYHKAVPIMDVIAAVNRLYKEGHYIKIFTARGMDSGKDFKELTKKQLKEWNVKHHILIMNKPAADVYVDDKCCSIDDFTSKTFRGKWVS